MENIKLGDWIAIGVNHIPAVICNILENGKIIEVVYLSAGDKAINEYANYENGKWDFINNSGMGGGYADKYSRLNEYVGILRRGRNSKL